MNLKEALTYYGKTSVWHFTDKSNLVSIEKYGLLSLDIIIKEDIYVSCYGADELSHKLDRNRGLDKFVHLSLIREHPMQYVKTRDGEIPDPIWLEIDASVLFENQSIFSDRVANSNTAKLYEINDLDQVIDLEVLWGRTNWSDPIIQERRKIAKKSELMVANRIDINKILGVYNG